MKKLLKKGLLAVALFGMGTSFVAEAAAASETPAKPEMNANKTLNVAHRGASGHAPEHTLTAYELGEQMHGDYVEIDLQMTKDGELIAMHDETLDRTTNGSGLVKDHTLEEIKQLDAGSWFNEKYPDMAKEEYKGLKVPTLDEVIEKFGNGANYYIETKSPEVYPGMEEKLLQTLENHNVIGENNPSSRVIIQSFSPSSLKKVHKSNPNIPLVQLLSYSSSATITDQELEMYKQYAVGLGMNGDYIDEQYVQKVREHELLIHPYTVNEKAEMQKLLDWGVTGMFTNYPDRLNDVLTRQ